MTQHPAIAARNQSLTPGELVELFTIDVSPLGLDELFNFTPRGAPATWRGTTFAAVDCEVEGFEFSGDGPLPQPKFRITNATNLMIAATVRFSDLVGATFIRNRTYADYLDDGAEPGTDADFSADIYTFEQKAGQEDTQIEWTLSSAMDQDGRMIPGRTMRRDTCGWRYRFFNADSTDFRYQKALCPYKGDAYFDRLGQPTDKSHDRCGKRLSDCKLRYGANGVLPYGGFIGMSRVQR